MKKRTKLTEKAARIPDIRHIEWEKTISQYLGKIEQLDKEQARSIRFGMVVKDLLSFEPGFIDSYVSGIEKYLKVQQKDRLLRGEADNLFGNLIIEFEVNIPKKRSEAEEQLRRYVAILWSQEPPNARIPYICVATDGVRFVTYSPRVANTVTQEVSPDDVHLHVVEEADWTKLKPPEVFYWLDRYFLRKEIFHPTSLATLAKLMSWMCISESSSLPGVAQNIEMLEGELFKRQGIENFIEEDFFSWLARGLAVKGAVSVVRWLFSLLQNYNLRELSEDVLKSLYQELEIC